MCSEGDKNCRNRTRTFHVYRLLTVCFLHQIHPFSLACAIVAGVFVLVSETNLSLDCICVVSHLAPATLINKILQELIENCGKSRFYTHDDSESQLVYGNIHTYRIIHYRYNYLKQIAVLYF